MDVGSDKRTVEELAEIRVYLPSAAFELYEEQPAYVAKLGEAVIALIPPVVGEGATQWWCTIKCNSRERTRSGYGASHRHAFRQAVVATFARCADVFSEKTSTLLRAHAIRSML